MDRHALLETNLKQLKLPTFVQNYRPFAEDALKAHKGYDAYLLALTEQEVAQREANRQRLCIKAARFPLLKELADFDFSCVPALNKQQVLDLARGEYLAKAEPILLVGNPGLGKTHIAISLALAACRQSRRVRFYTAAGLVNELIEAQDQHRLPRLLKAALKRQLIVLDELGFIPFTPLGAQLLFQFCSSLNERVALIVTTNLKFADWAQVFGDERLTAALVDRLTHRLVSWNLPGSRFDFVSGSSGKDEKRKNNRLGSVAGVKNKGCPMRGARLGTSRLHSESLRCSSIGGSMASKLQLQPEAKESVGEGRIRSVARIECSLNSGHSPLPMRLRKSHVSRHSG